MASASLALQAAILSALTGHAPLVALLAGPRVYDDVPPNAQYPYLTFGQSSQRDWSTGTEEGAEHLVTIHVWSRAAGRRQVHDIAAAIHAAVHDRPLALTGYRLVNLRHEFSESRRDGDGETYRGVIRYRAVTEPI